jgi:hypothetical protein
MANDASAKALEEIVNSVEAQRGNLRRLESKLAAQRDITARLDDTLDQTLSWLTGAVAGVPNSDGRYR